LGAKESFGANPSDPSSSQPDSARVETTGFKGDQLRTILFAPGQLISYKPCAPFGDSHNHDEMGFPSVAAIRATKKPAAKLEIKSWRY
jgi:hypothetical protein